MEKNTPNWAGGSPEVTTEPDVRPKKADLGVELEAVDVWTLGLLIEADVAQFPPTVEAEILAGYRVLKASGYRPPTDALPRVDVQLSDALPDADAPSQAPLAREVVVSEVTTAEPDPQPTITRLPDRSTPGVDPVVREEIQRLSVAVEAVPDRLDRLEAALEDDEPAAEEPRQQPVALTGALTAVSGLGAVLFVTVVALLVGPVFAVLGLALLAAAGIGTYAFLAGALDEEQP